MRKEMAENQDPNPTSPRGKTSPAWFILLGAVVLGLIVMIGAWMKKSDAKMLEIGQPVPDFSLTSFDHETYNLSQLRGKVVLINVWASWCYTCDEESFMLQEVWGEVEPAGDTLFLGVDYVDTEKPALEFIAAHGMTYPNGPDLGSEISKILKIQGVPETFLIDADGILRAIQIGPFASADDVREFLTQAIN
jgi:cytochrome c biogenesis protein CcmG/thiol:disulfide interchange protein DsbE